MIGALQSTKSAASANLRLWGDYALADPWYLLAIPVGLLSGGVIILFRLLVEHGAALYMPGADGENFEALSITLRLLLPAAGGLLIGLIESFWSGYFTIEYKDVAAFSILVLVLIFRPTGLLGRPEVEKV